MTTFDVALTVDGEQEILEGDFVTADLKIKLTRSVDRSRRHASVAAFAAQRKEGWRVFVYDQSTNTLLANKVLTDIELDKMERGQEPLAISMQFMGMPSECTTWAHQYDAGDFWICRRRQVFHHDEGVQDRGQLGRA